MIPIDFKGKRLVLFGAGRVARLMFSRFPELNVVAFADNDSAKHGTFVGKVPVVQPEALRHLEYDLVVISTGWWESITAQLQALGVAPSRIVLPPKNMLAINNGEKPFSHAPTKALALEVLGCVADFSARHAIPIMLDFGTLLGAVRDGDLIPWDDDIDFSLNDHAYPLFVNHLADLKVALPKPAGCDLDMTVLEAEDLITGVAVTYRNAVGCNAIVPFEIGFMRRVIENGQSVTKGAGPSFIAPEVHFHNVGSITFLGKQFCTPDDALGYLSYVYGDWKTPRQDVTLAEYPMQESEYLETSRTLV
ncbi:hypothetical protein DA83_05370 [Pseudomonas sp. 250J]|uniref:LicD family protein n=1 Tax=Pseudomonas peradeniyensis TaxID=2745488 RepID=A0ABT2VCM5_9PSED|nr:MULTISPECIES: LicD family protein [Pseudomonas]KNX76808.1 hypothetical protein DA83_05370 [Pseudomonas sp. 250J]MCU7239313.1 LicD family protein [Pseudomonas peradeniyensis]MCU7281543.1 LicD family protein [Pseudomonas peradeniyensis]QZA55897.1 LicD family protein [Pseudomonas sp. 2hn]